MKQNLDRDIRSWKNETERIIEALTDEIDELEKEKENLEEKIDDLEKQISERDEEIEELKGNQSN